MSTVAVATAPELKSPDALIPGYEKCYVVGCWQNAVLSARHKNRGAGGMVPVVSCPGHNPANHGMAKLIVREPLVLTEGPERSEADESLDEVRELTPEERIAVLLRELLAVAGQPPSPKPDADKGMGARLKPVQPKMPPGAVGLVPR